MRSRRYFLSSIVWLTAVANLAAGAPQSVCVCPSRSPECCASADLPATNTPNAKSEQVSDCCQSAPPKKPAKQGTCCQHGSQPSHPAPKPSDGVDTDSKAVPAEAGPALDRQPCQRGTLVPEPQIVNKTEHQGDHSAPQQFESTIDAAVPPTATAATRIWSQASVLPPTLDLSTLLQRLTI
jgi:hypothetical protein